MDWKLDTDGDLYLDDSGSAVNLTGADAIAQHISIRLRMFLGEWFLDTREGVPWFDLMEKGASTTRIRAVVREVITKTPGVGSLDELDVELDSDTRKLTVTAKGTYDTGEALDYSEAFIVGQGGSS